MSIRTHNLLTFSVYGLVRLFMNDFTLPRHGFLQDFFNKKKDYIQTQVGNPEGSDKPNKKVSRGLVLLRGC